MLEEPKIRCADGYLGHVANVYEIHASLIDDQHGAGRIRLMIEDAAVWEALGAVCIYGIPLEGQV